MGFVIGMAGHVDHGKSSVIKALTGITTARYREEIEREITIDIGFAHLDIEGAGKVSIIDVPGHEDFVHNMLAGVFDIRLALLVIAASEGIMPQTIEHFEILKLCGTPKLLVILNKSDLVSEYDLEFRRMEIEDFLKGSRFENSPVIPFSAITKRGAEDIALAIKNEMLSNRAPADKKGGQNEPVFYPVDRVFEKSGYGQVLTGTLSSGVIAMGETYFITAAAGGFVPGSDPNNCKIRAIESHGSKLERIDPGSRAALNITRNAAYDIKRGSFLISAEFLNFKKIITVRFSTTSSVRNPIKSGTHVKFYFYTACYSGKLRLLDRAKIAEPGEYFAQIIFDAPEFVLPFKRFILRPHTDEETIGGGVIVDFDDEIIKNKKSVLASLSPFSQALHSGERELSLIYFKNTANKEFYIEKSRAALFLGSVKTAVSKLIKTLMPEFSPVEIGENIVTNASLIDEAKNFVLRVIGELLKNNQLLKTVPKNILFETAGIKNEKYKIEFYNYILEALLSEKALAGSEGAYTITSCETGVFSKLSDPSAEAIRKKILAIFNEKTGEPKDIVEVKKPLPKNQSGLFTQTLKFMEFEKQIYKVFENYYISSEQFIFYRDTAEELCRQKGSFTVIEFKEKTGFSRKYAVGILEFFDRINFTSRNGNDRTINK